MKELRLRSREIVAAFRDVLVKSKGGPAESYAGLAVCNSARTMIAEFQQLEAECGIQS